MSAILNLPLSISAVERNTGLSKDTLRVWERRYGFPTPARDAHGERVYPPEQVEKLRIIKHLMDRGLRPGKLIGQDLAELKGLADEHPADGSPPLNPELAALMDLLRGHRVTELRQQLMQSLHRQGLEHFISDVVAPMNTEVGEAWMRGDLEVYEEHLYTEVAQGLLRSTINGLPAGSQAPRVLLTTLPGEVHQLGLLMAEAIFTLNDAGCISLGTQTPARDIALAAESHSADVVALSFSAAFPAAQVAEALASLRGQLPERIELWAGGGNPGLGRRIAPGVTVLRDLEQIGAAVAAWRASRTVAVTAASVSSHASDPAKRT